MENYKVIAALPADMPPRDPATSPSAWQIAAQEAAGLAAHQMDVLEAIRAYARKLRLDAQLNRITVVAIHDKQAIAAIDSQAETYESVAKTLDAILDGAGLAEDVAEVGPTTTVTMNFDDKDFDHRR